MPPTRRQHHKSRKGCFQCKKRHVKCDEVQPSCGNCVKREANCSYSVNEQSPSVGNENLDSPDASEARQQVLSRTEEMDLMHFFTTTTIKTTCHDPKDWHMWEFAIPQLAFHNENFWIRSAIEYQNRALPVFFKVLSDVNDESCHAAFAFSMITSMVEIAMPRIDFDPIEHLVGLRNYFRGTATLYLTMLEYLRYGPLDAFFKGKTVKWEYDPEIRKSFHDRITALYDIVAGSPEQKIYNETIALLLRLFDDSPYTIMVFSLFVGPDFFQLVCQREPLAVLIYIYCGVVFNNVNEWWGEDVGKRIVNGLTLPADVLEANPSWASALLWAKEQVMKSPEPDKIQFWRIFDTEQPNEEVTDLLHPDDTLLTLRSNNASAAATPNQPAQVPNGQIQD